MRKNKVLIFAIIFSIISLFFAISSFVFVLLQTEEKIINASKIYNNGINYVVEVNDYNKKLEQQGNGVKYGNFITRQNETYLKDYKCGNYRFGFTTFSGVGCEVASAYNAMIALGKTEMLSETIYSFEKWAIEFAIAWGKFGSNPLQISTYLNKKGIGCSKITNYNNFKSQVEKQANCHIIMSRWNNSWTDGLHTFYIKKQDSKYYSYNWVYSYATVDRNNIDDFNDGSGFIVGYILWKK